MRDTEYASSSSAQWQGADFVHQSAAKGLTCELCGPSAQWEAVAPRLFACTSCRLIYALPEGGPKVPLRFTGTNPKAPSLSGYGIVPKLGRESPHG